MGSVFKTIFCAAIVCAAAFFSLPAFADKRVALVIGNSSYKNVSPLENSNNDAVLIANTLKDLGFQLINHGAQLDLRKGDIDKVVQEFGRELPGADVALFYYAGHGIQSKGSNYLVPIDANPVREADIDFQMLNVSLVMQEMEDSGTKLNLIILDACRNNPFAIRSLRGPVRGLAQMQVPEGTLISYATQPGNVAQDGSDGHSPYTRALATVIRRPGLDIFQTFNEIGLAVKRATGGTQEPWVASSPIEGKFYFAGLADGHSATETSAEPSIPVASEDIGLLAPRDMSRVRAVATKHDLTVPQFAIRSPDAKLPDKARRFIGVWASEVGWNGSRRQAMLVVNSVDLQSRTSGFFIWGPPNPNAPPDLRFPAGYLPFAGQITGNQLNFRTPTATVTVTYESNDTLFMSQKRAGRTNTVSLGPVWRLGASQAQK